MEKVNLRDKFSLFSDYWKPRVAGELNGQQVKLVKFNGPFVWHHHDTEDELFLVVHGKFRMEFRDRDVLAGKGRIPHRSPWRRASACRRRRGPCSPVRASFDPEHR